MAQVVEIKFMMDFSAISGPLGSMQHENAVVL